MADSKNNDIDKTTVNTSLKKITAGTIVVVFGTFLGALLFFLVRILIIKNWSQFDYGIFTAALSIPVIILIFSTFGIGTIAVRNIAYARGLKDEKEITTLVTSFFSVFTIAGFVSGLLLYLLSDFIAYDIFNRPALALPLKIFSLALPITKIAQSLSGIFRGFDKVAPKILFYDIIKHFIFLIIVFFIVIYELDFINVYYAYIIAMVISCILLYIYAVRKISFHKFLNYKLLNKAKIKELIFLSAPIFIGTIITLFTNWIDTFMILALKSPESVAQYDSVVVLSATIAFPLGALTMIYMPIISGLYIKKKYNEMKHIYKILTKWLFFLTLPIFLTFILFPEIIIGFLYTSEYLIASRAMQIICISSIATIILGLNSQNLVITGKLKIILIASIISAVVNISLNYYLIPIYGINGAAFASMISIIITNSFLSILLYYYTKVQPFSKNLIKPIVLVILSSLGIYYLFTTFIDINVMFVAIFYILMNLIFFISIIITKSVDKEDLDMLISFERRTGIKLSFLKKLFEKAI